MMKVLAFAALIALSQAQESFENVQLNLQVLPAKFQLTPRIVNGQSAAPKQFPHQALVFINTLQGTFQCGGSLISPLWVLSAAHCVTGIRSARILLGSVSRTAMPVQREAIQVNTLSTYSPTTLRDDISLIKLSISVPFTSNVRSIALPSLSQASATYLNRILVVSGFGLTTANQVASTLQYTNVTGISNAECMSIYGLLIVPTILCTRGYPNLNQGSCQGDSGGPLISQGSNATLVGIVSFGAAQSCTAGFPQGYTRVGSYLSWISSVTDIALRN